MRLDGENAHAERRAARVFEQSGVLLPAHDVLVDRARLRRVEQLGLHVLAADLHRELIEMRALRNRENVFALKVRVVRIEELLLDARDRFLPGDVHVHLVKRDLQRREDVVRRRHRAMRRMRERRCEWRRIVDDDESVGARAADECEKSREHGEEFCFHVPRLPRRTPACVRALCGVCQKIVTRGLERFRK